MEPPSSRRRGWNWRGTVAEFGAGEGERRKNQRKPIVRREEKIVVMNEFALAFGFIVCQERKGKGISRIAMAPGGLVEVWEGNCPALLHVVRRPSTECALRTVLGGQTESQDEALQGLEPVSVEGPGLCVRGRKLCDARLLLGRKTSFSQSFS